MNNGGKVRYGMVIDLRRCIGCHSCSIACKSENNVPLGVFRSWVKQIEKGRYPRVMRAFLPSLCNNCEKPICVKNCPVNASYQRDDGIVMIDVHRCIGCRYCIASCPYDARYLDPIKHIVQKCFWCYHRIDAGLEPACVDTCIGRARIFGNLNDIESEVSRLITSNAVQVLKPEMDTEPRVFYIQADIDAMETRGGSIWLSI